MLEATLLRIECFQYQPDFHFLCNGYLVRCQCFK